MFGGVLMRLILVLGLLSFCWSSRHVFGDEFGVAFSSEPSLQIDIGAWDLSPTWVAPTVDFGLVDRRSIEEAGPLTFLSDIVLDHRDFYSRSNLYKVGSVFAVGGVVANTGIDGFFRNAYRDNLVNLSHDEYSDFFHQTHFLGDWHYALPAFAAATASGWLLEDHLWPARYFAEWGERSLRTMILGGPLVLTTQRLTGGSRPEERDSRWRPLQDSNGASGHSYVGAVPFLSAAYMTERRWLRYSLIAASTLPAISRVNDDAHYPSQAAMGWSFAFLAAQTVHRTRDDHRAVPD